MALEGSASTYVSGLDCIYSRSQRGIVGCFFVSALFKCWARSDGSGTYNHSGKWATKARCIRNFVISWYETPPNHPLCMQKNPPCMHRTPSVWEFPGIPKKGPFSRREFQWEFQRFPTSGIPAVGIPSNYYLSRSYR